MNRLIRRISNQIEDEVNHFAPSVYRAALFYSGLGKLFEGFLNGTISWQGGLPGGKFLRGSGF